MATISIALVQVRFFKGSAAGLCTIFNGIKKHFCILSNILPHHLKHSSHRGIQNSLGKYQVNERVTQNKRFNEFKAVKLDAVFKRDFAEGAVLHVFNKLLAAYEVSLSAPSFERDLQAFKNGKDFIEFCKALESKVDKFSLNTLLLLYDLEYFNVPQTNSLMTKISKLILDKLNTSSFYDKLLIYGATLSKPYKERNRKNIIDKCEHYIKERLDYDLQCKGSSFNLISLFQIKGLPKNVKLLLAEKLNDEILSDEVDKRLATETLYKLACKEDDLLPKQRWLNLISHCLRVNSSFSLLRVISATYVALLQKDMSYYSPELIELIIKKLSGRMGSAVQIGEGLCGEGYFSREFLDAVIGSFFSETYCLEKECPLMCLLSFLAQASFHEVVPESSAQHIKNILETKNTFDIISDLPNNSLCCAYLTYIGCDTRVLLSRIFKRANNEVEVRDSNLLTLHHLAKAYFPGEYVPLSQKTVNSLVEDEFKKSDLWDPENSVSQCFESGDYILRNCITSDRHCLHFVTVFQSDRKPMNLASYSKMLQPKIFFNVDTIKKPRGSKMIAFVLFPYKQPIKFLNLPSMSGSAKMYLKSFEGISCNIVLLHKTFFSLSLEDKKKFLKSQIDEIFEKSEDENK